MRARVRILWDRRRRTGNGHTDQLRLWHEKPSTPFCRPISQSPHVVDVLLRALHASPEIWMQPLGEAVAEGGK